MSYYIPPSPLKNCEFLSVEDVKREVERIRNTNWHPVQHEMEKDLYSNVLHTISMHYDDPVELAREALKTREIIFYRFYSMGGATA